MRNARQATFERILANAPATFTAPLLGVHLSALVNLDPCDFAEDGAAFFVGDSENNEQTADSGEGGEDEGRSRQVFTKEEWNN